VVKLQAVPTPHLLIAFGFQTRGLGIQPLHILPSLVEILLGIAELPVELPWLLPEEMYLE